MCVGRPRLNAARPGIWAEVGSSTRNGGDLDEPMNVRWRLRLCANTYISGAWRCLLRQARAAGEGHLTLRLHLCNQRPRAKDLEHSLQVVGQNLQAHLGSHARKSFGQEVRGSHPRFQRSEHMLDCLAS